MGLQFGAAPRAPTRVPLGRGVVVTLGALDSFEHSAILSLARREIDALVEDRPPRRDWGLAEAEVAAVQGDADARAAVFGWMRTVLIAEKAALAIEGVDGAPDDRFALYAWLFRDARFEAAFAQAALAVEIYWTEEGNASGAAPNGSTVTAPTTAANAAPPASPAPTAGSATTDSVAPASPTPPTAPKATSPGTSPGPTASGEPQG